MSCLTPGCVRVLGLQSWGLRNMVRGFGYMRGQGRDLGGKVGPCTVFYCLDRKLRMPTRHAHIEEAAVSRACTKHPMLLNSAAWALQALGCVSASCCLSVRILAADL